MDYFVLDLRTATAALAALLMLVPSISNASSDQAIRKRTAATACEAPTVAYWRFDDNYVDACGTLHGTPTSSAQLDTVVLAPLPGNASSVHLNGVSGRVDLPTQFASTIGTLPEGTIEAWIYLSGTSGVIFNHGVAARSTDLQLAVLAENPGVLRLHTTGAGNFDFALAGFSLNRWHHVACTWKAGMVRAYLDGSPIGVINRNLSISWGGNEAEIGSDDQEVGYWPGRLDELRLSNRALQPSELLIGDVQPNLVQNGDFHLNADGWALINHYAANWYGSPAPGAEGLGWDGTPGCFFVNHAPGGHPETSQLVTGLTPGWRYLVSGYFRRHTRNHDDLNFRVLLDDTISFQAGGTVEQGWTPFSFPYFATDGDVRLRFQSQITGDDAYFIDHIAMFRMEQVDDGSLPSDMVLIPGGQFLMGDESGAGDLDEVPRHTVRLDSLFMDRYVVTNQQYADGLNWALSHGLIYVSGGVVYGSGNNVNYCDTATAPYGNQITWNGTLFGVVPDKVKLPMVRVSWYGAAAYANWRSQMEGRSPCYDTSNWSCNFLSGGYRLPTEAEWEYAARGGLRYAKYPWGTDINGSNANYLKSEDPHEGGSYPWTTPVDYYAPNGYGMYDMAGNVLQWTNDWYDAVYYSASPSVNPRGPVTGSGHVSRGGSWVHREGDLRCANRSVDVWLGRYDGIGFRLAFPAWGVLQNSQSQPGSDPQPSNQVTFEHLWRWDASAGRFVDPGPNGLTIYPDKPTYLLTHGWDGSLDGRTCGNMYPLTCTSLNDPDDKPEFSMSSVASAIKRAKGDTINLIAWDWADHADWDGECNSAELLARLRDGISERCLGLTGGSYSSCAIVYLLRAIAASGQWAGDAFWTGTEADAEGNALGQALAQLPTLGKELHLIGKSHGGGVMGRVAAKLKQANRPATSITTIDTPNVFGLINTLKHVNPDDVLTKAVVLYYPSLLHGGVGQPIHFASDKLTNLALSTAFGSFPRHLWAAGKDDCECTPYDGWPGWSFVDCEPDDGWFPLAVWEQGSSAQPLSFSDVPGALTSILDLDTIPAGNYVEIDSNQYAFIPGGACYLGGLCTIGDEESCVAIGGLYSGDHTNCTEIIAGRPTVAEATTGLSLIRYEPFHSAASWSGNLAQLTIGTDPNDPMNRVIVMQEQGDASLFKDITWPDHALMITFDYMFRDPRGKENLTVYVNNQIVYYDNAETTLAGENLTLSGAIYVGNVASQDQPRRLNFVYRTDQTSGGEGQLLIDNIRVYGFLEADPDLDGDRDLADFAAFQRCFALTPPADECWGFDVDASNSIDVPDYAGDSAQPPAFTGFTDVFVGPSAPPIP